MKIVFIAPLPPPVSGNSLAAKVLLDDLVINHDVEVVNLNKDILVKGNVLLKRIRQIFRILKQIWTAKRNVDAIYLTVSQTLAGNIRDILIYLLCFRHHRKMVIHLHGGYMKASLFDRYKLLYAINRYFIRRFRHVVVLGQSHVHIFEDIVPPQKIQIVPNFAEDDLFRSEQEILQKFNCMPPLRILYLSNMLTEKGYNELVDAYLSLPDHVKEKIAIDFAGEFEYDSLRNEFLEKIKDSLSLKYHGYVFGENKKALLQKAHLFCLPTYYRNEGQPISILEAYASGCVVITTDHSGIRDVFKDGVNGIYVEKKSARSLCAIIEQIVQNTDSLAVCGLRNRNTAFEKYRTTIYNKSLRKLIVEHAE